ncbi:MAG: serine/threonine-protein phosphatase [Opitutae bacterium]|nr:serine/threonine-protein phosphatase [Opitutae bacterium]
MDTERGQVTLTQAGHPGALWLRAEAEEVVVTGTGGFPVGLLPELEYEAIHLDLARGDRLFLYSDGVTECENAGGEQFSLSRLMAVLERTRELPLAEVTREVGAALSQWKGDEHYQDDISLLALEYDAESRRR